MEEFSRYWAQATRNRVSRRTALRGAALTSAGLAAAALVGCGGDDTPAATPAAAVPSSPTTPTEQQPAAPAVKTGGRLALVHARNVSTWDTHASSTVDTNSTTSFGHAQLIKQDPMVGEETPESVIGDLATEWEISPDGQTYTFKLVQNAKFHDGKPFTAADVKASYERQKDPPEGLVNPPRGAQIQWIGSIDTPDDYTITFNMARPVSPLSVMPIFAQAWMVIYSKADIDAGFDFRRNQNGLGPWKLRQYEEGNRITWDKNPDFFVEGSPYMDGIDLFIIPQEQSRLAAFQAGQLHWMDGNVAAIDTIRQTMGDQAVIQESNGFGFSTMNYGGREPWTDERVRQAVAMAHDKQAGMDVLIFGDGRFGGYMSGGGYWSVTGDELATIPGYEPHTGDATVAEARKMLDAAGVPARLNVNILTRQNASEDFSLYIQDQMAKVGLICNLDIQDTAMAYDIMAKRDFDWAPWGHAYAVDDPDAVFYEFYTQDAPRNYSQIGTPEIDDLVLKQSMEQDPETRRELVRELQFKALPLHGKTIFYWSNGRDATWNYVKDYVRHNSNYNNKRYQDVWLDL